MAWTTPRDWTSGEVVTESMMDVHVKDNLTYLYGVLNGTVTQNLTLLGRVFLPDGVIGDPALMFTSDPDTGIFRSFANELTIVAGGGYSARFGVGRVFFEDGTIGSPGITFAADIDTGLYRSGADGLNLVAGGLLCLIAYAVGGGSRLGFFGATGTAKPTVSGAKAGNAALASLATALHNLGLITDTTT